MCGGNDEEIQAARAFPYDQSVCKRRKVLDFPLDWVCLWEKYPIERASNRWRRLTVKFSEIEKSFGKNSIKFSTSDEIFIQPWIWLSLFDLTLHLPRIGWTRMPECIMFKTWFPHKPVTFLDRLDLCPILWHYLHCYMCNLSLTGPERFSLRSVFLWHWIRSSFTLLTWRSPQEFILVNKLLGPLELIFYRDVLVLGNVVNCQLFWKYLFPLCVRYPKLFSTFLTIFLTSSFLSNLMTL